jgi:hypothetical protein
MPKQPNGFVALSALKSRALTAAEALAQIRRIYFRTSATTIEHDLAHAIELFTGLDEESRERAAGYMDGLGELRSEWRRAAPPSRTGSERPGAARPSRERNPEKSRR